MNTIMDLPIWNLAIAYVFVLLLLVLSKARGIGREKFILTATVRMTVQLTLMGFVLMYVFDHPSWWLTSLMLCVMLAFAIRTACRRVSKSLPKSLRRLIGICLISSYIVTALVFLLAVLRVTPWFNPQYCIPISGMIIGSGMVQVLSNAFVAISTPQTFPLFTFLSADLVNIFIPSGGGQWAIQGPIMMEAAQKLGADIPQTIMAFA